jgi:apolipoprotein N-acyltransferase
MTLTSLSHSVTLAWGWKRWLIACAAGAVSAAALPPLDLWPIPFLTFPVLVWLLDGAAAGRWRGVPTAFATGWWFGFGYFLAGLYWIGNAFLVDAKIFGWLMPFAVIGLPIGLAVFTALGTALARLLWARGPARLLALTAALTATDWLRGHIFTGFPWNSFGYALASPPALAQAAAWFGLWGLTAIAVLAYASPAVLADDRSDSKRRWLAPALCAILLAGLAAGGAWRLNSAPTQFVDGVKLRIMQPNLQQDEKFNYSQKQSVMARYLTLSDRASGPQSAGIRDVTHLIWPESAFPFFLTREPDALAQIAALLPAGTVLITGAIRAPEAAPPGPVKQAYNSVYVIDHDGSILSVYDKVHLVPFGEYLPFQNLFERLGLMALTKVQGGFIAGDRRRALDLPRAPSFLPLLCYEVIFPGEAVPRSERPRWLLNLTNDGWFGRSPGPYQHFQQARLRAIEEGLPLVRAANTGISAVIDPLGRVLAVLPLGTEGVLDAALPKPLPPTVYTRVGDIPVGLAVAGAALLALRKRRRDMK